MIEWGVDLVYVEFPHMALSAFNHRILKGDDDFKTIRP
jgi:hypothetical protein